MDYWTKFEGWGETFENVDHVTWISGVVIWLYLLSLCVCV